MWKKIKKKETTLRQRVTLGNLLVLCFLPFSLVFVWESGSWRWMCYSATVPEWAVPLWTGMATHRQSIRLRPHRLRYKSVGALSSTPCSFYSEEAGLNRHSFHLSSDLDFRVHSFGVLHILEFLLKKKSVFVRRQSCMVFYDVHLNVHEARVEIRYNVSPASVIAPVLLHTHFFDFFYI